MRAVFWLWTTLLGPQLAIPSPHVDDPEIPERGVDLTWSAPVGCPDAVAFANLLGSLLASTLELRDDASIKIEGDIRPSEAGFALKLSLVTPNETVHRELSAETCDALVQAGAVIVAAPILASGNANQAAPVSEILQTPEAGNEATNEATNTPVAHATSPPASSIPTTPTAEAGRVEDPPPPTRASKPPRFRERSFIVGVMAGPTFRIGPGLTSGWLQAYLGVRGKVWSVEAVGVHNFQTESPARDQISAVVRLWAGGLRLCWRPNTASLEFPLCGGLLAGAAIGEGRGPLESDPVPSTRPWVVLPIEVGLLWPRRGRVALRTTIGGAITVVAPRYHAVFSNSAEEIWQAPRLGVFVSVGPQVSLPLHHVP